MSITPESRAAFVPPQLSEERILYEEPELHRIAGKLIDELMSAAYTVPEVDVNPETILHDATTMSTLTTRKTRFPLFGYEWMIDYQVSTKDEDTAVRLDVTRKQIDGVVVPRVDSWDKDFDEELKFLVLRFPDWPAMAFMSYQAAWSDTGKSIPAGSMQDNFTEEAARIFARNLRVGIEALKAKQLSPREIQDSAFLIADSVRAALGWEDVVPQSEERTFRRGDKMISVDFEATGREDQYINIRYAAMSDEYKEYDDSELYYILITDAESEVEIVANSGDAKQTSTIRVGYSYGEENTEYARRKVMAIIGLLNQAPVSRAA